VTGPFRILEALPGSLALKVGPYAFGQGVGELYDFIASALESGSVSLITLDASDATDVTLEGVVALIRIRERAAEGHVEFRIAPSNPKLQHKLAETGTLNLFASV
jgi:hypothetical protein